VGIANNFLNNLPLDRPQEFAHRKLQSGVRKVFSHPFSIFRSTIQSIKCTVLHDFGGLRRSPRVCKSLKNLRVQLSRQRSRVRAPSSSPSFQKTQGMIRPQKTTKNLTAS
jgi:hypothetical protein